MITPHALVLVDGIGKLHDTIFLMCNTYLLFPNHAPSLFGISYAFVVQLITLLLQQLLLLFQLFINQLAKPHAQHY